MKYLSDDNHFKAKINSERKSLLHGTKDALDGKRMPDSATSMNFMNLIVCPNIGRGERKVGRKDYYFSESFLQVYRSLPHVIPLLPYTYSGANYEDLMNVAFGNASSDPEARKTLAKIGNEIGRDMIRQLERIHDNFMGELYDEFLSESDHILRTIQKYRNSSMTLEEKKRLMKYLQVESESDELHGHNTPLKNQNSLRSEDTILKALEQEHLQRRFLMDFLKKIRFAPFCFFVGQGSRSKLDTVYFYYEITRIVEEKGQIGSFSTEIDRTQTLPRIMIFSPQKPDALLDWMEEFTDIHMNPRVFKKYIMQIINIISELFYGVLPTFERRYPLQRPVCVPILSVTMQQAIQKDVHFYENERLDTITMKICPIWKSCVKRCENEGKLTSTKRRWNALHWMRGERSFGGVSNLRASYGIYAEFRKAFRQSPPEAKIFAGVLMTSLVWNGLRCTGEISYRSTLARRTDGKAIFLLTGVENEKLLEQHTLFNSELVQIVKIKNTTSVEFSPSLKLIDKTKSPLCFFFFSEQNATLSESQCNRLLSHSSITVLVNATVPEKFDNVIELPFYAIKKDLSYLGDTRLWYHIQDLAYQKMNSLWFAEYHDAQRIDQAKPGHVMPSYQIMTDYEKKASEFYKESGLRGHYSTAVKPFLSAAAFYDDFETENQHFFITELQDAFRAKLRISGRVANWNQVLSSFVLYLSTLRYAESFEEWQKQVNNSPEGVMVPWKDEKYLYLPYERFWGDFVEKNPTLYLSPEKDVKRKFIQEILLEKYHLAGAASRRNGRLPRADFRRKDEQGKNHSFIRIRIDAVMKRTDTL